MKQNVFTVPAMPKMDFAIKKTELNALSPLNQSEAHIHKTCEVYVNLSGNVSFAVEDRLYPVSRGTVIITKPYEYHHCIYRSSDPHAHFWITFSAEQDQDFLKVFFDREKGVDNRIVLDEPALQELCDLLEELMDDQTDELDRRIGSLRFFRILVNGRKISKTVQLEKLPPDVAAALEYMEQHLCEDIDIPLLAKACHVSVNTLERHFKESIGTSPFAAIRKKRLFTSMMFLRNGESVTDAARKSGFSDYSNYIQLFRRQFGITPGKYKKMQEEN